MSCKWTHINARAAALEEEFCQGVLTRSTKSDHATQDIARMVQRVGMSLYLYQASEREIAVAEAETLTLDGRSSYRFKEVLRDGCHREVVATVLNGMVTLRRSDSSVAATAFKLSRVKVAFKRGLLYLSYHRPSGLVTSKSKYLIDDESVTFATHLDSLSKSRRGPAPKLKVASAMVVDAMSKVAWAGKALVGFIPTSWNLNMDDRDFEGEPRETPDESPADARPLDDSASAPTKVRHCMVRFWGEDVTRPTNHRDPLGVNDVVYMNMVDFYLESGDWASKVCLGQPVLLRTLDITTPCGQEKHRRWRFEKSRLIYNIFYDSQGQKVEKTFDHELWHWTSGDVLEIGDYIYRVRVRKIALSDDIKFVLLTPIARKPATPVQVTLGLLGVNPRFVHSDGYKGFWNTVIRSQLAGLSCFPTGLEATRPGLMSVPMLSEGLRPTLRDAAQAWTLWLLNHKADSLASHALGRVNINVSTAKGVEYTVMCTFEPGDAFEERRRKALAAETPMKPVDLERSLVHVAVSGSYKFHTYTQTQWSEARTQAKLGPTDCKDAWDIRNASDRLFLLNTVAGLAGVDTATRQKFLVWTYGHMVDVPDKIRSANTLGDPWLRTVLAPMDSWDNEQQGIWARVMSQMGGPDRALEPELMQSIREFVDLCLAHIGCEGDIHPDGNDETLERMATPRQRESIVRSILDEFQGDHVMRPFVKMENRDDDARIISPYAGRGKAPYTALVHALMTKAIEKLPFVLCGKSPAEVEAKVASICAHAVDLRVVEGDIKRMDGNVHMPQRVLWAEYGVLFDSVAQDLFVQEQRCTVGLESKSSNGVRFCGGVAIPSGVPDTTGSNTMGNGASLYHAKRLDGFSPLEAWHWICTCVVVSGDDSLIADMPKESVARGIASFGHQPKVKERHDENFTLLGRMYGTVSSVASGIVNNCQDPERVYDRLTLCVGKLYDEVERRRRYFDKACAILTQDPESYGISAIADCIVRAGEKYYGWSRFENFDMNYNVKPGRYTNQYCMWFEEVNRRIWPDHDWTGMITWCAGDRTWAEIERHPNFAPDIEVIREDVTLFVKDCDHSRHDFCDLQGNIDRGSDKFVPSVESPHFPEGTSIEDQKKAFKQCFDRERKRYADWCAANPRPANFAQALATLRTHVRIRQAEVGEDDIMEDPTFIELVKHRADLEFVERFETRERLSKRMRAGRDKFLLSISTPMPQQACHTGDAVIASDGGEGVFPPPPLQQTQQPPSVLVLIPDDGGQGQGSDKGPELPPASPSSDGSAQGVSGATSDAEVVQSPPPAAAAPSQVQSVVTVARPTKTARAVYLSASPVDTKGMFPSSLDMTTWVKARAKHAQLMDKLKSEVKAEAKEFRKKRFASLKESKAKAQAVKQSKAAAAVADVQKRLERAKQTAPGKDVAKKRQSGKGEVQPAANAKLQKAVGKVVVTKLKHPPVAPPQGSPPASPPPTPPVSEAGSDGSSSDSSWDAMFDLSLVDKWVPEPHWKIARFYDFANDRWLDKEPYFPGTVEHLISLCRDSTMREHEAAEFGCSVERRIWKITRWIGGWNPAKYPSYSDWEKTHKAAEDAAIAARDLRKKRKKESKRLRAASRQGEPGSSTEPFVPAASVKLPVVAPKATTTPAAQGAVEAPPALVQEPVKKRKRNRRRAGRSGATSPDDKGDDKSDSGGESQVVGDSSRRVATATPVASPEHESRMEPETLDLDDLQRLLEEPSCDEYEYYEGYGGYPDDWTGEWDEYDHYGVDSDDYVAHSHYWGTY